jgi:hypothetical protein
LLEKLEALSAKSLSIRIETQVIAVNLKAGIAKLEDSVCRGSLAWLGRQTHNLADNQNQMRNLETNGAKRPMPEVAGSNPAPGTIAMLLFPSFFAKATGTRS